MNNGIEKMACFENGEGAIIYSPDYKPSVNGIIVSLAVVNTMDETIDRIKKHGGKILKEKTEIHRKAGGYFALCIDTEGNKIGLFYND